MNITMSDETLYSSPECFCHKELRAEPVYVARRRERHAPMPVIRLLKLLSGMLLTLLVLLAICMILLNLPFTLW